MNAGAKGHGEDARRLREFSEFDNFSDADRCVKSWTRLWRDTCRERQKAIRANAEREREHTWLPEHHVSTEFA
jgi:hypothetical protein